VLHRKALNTYKKDIFLPSLPDKITATQTSLSLITHVRIKDHKTPFLLSFIVSGNYVIFQTSLYTYNPNHALSNLATHVHDFHVNKRSPCKFYLDPTRSNMLLLESTLIAPVWHDDLSSIILSMMTTNIQCHLQEIASINEKRLSILKERLKVEKLLKSSACGQILLGTFENEILVIKFPATVEDAKELIDSEIEILKTIHHEHLLKIIGYGLGIIKSVDGRQYWIEPSDDSKYICLEYCEKGNYIEYLQKEGKVSLLDILKQMIQIVSAMMYLHYVVQIAHRDLKTDNVLVDKNGNIKLADFGFSTNLTLRTDNNINNILLSTLQCPHRSNGYPFFIDPQYFGNKAQPFHRKYDVYAFGAILYHIFILRIRNPERDSKVVFDQSIDVHPIVNEYIVPLIKGCIAESERLTFKQIHEFLEDLKEEIEVDERLNIILQF
jgi:tRNA A-37 threonylcarbamoyl transferase component Bud32